MDISDINTVLSDMNSDDGKQYKVYADGIFPTIACDLCSQTSISLCEDSLVAVRPGPLIGRRQVVRGLPTIAEQLVSEPHLRARHVLLECRLPARRLLVRLRDESLPGLHFSNLFVHLKAQLLVRRSSLLAAAFW
jgi:hypothetical protein